MKLFKSKIFWAITLYAISLLISIGFGALIILALVKFIWG